MPTTAEQRERWRPETPTLIFIGESPPENGRQWFYDDDAPLGPFGLTLLRGVGLWTDGMRKTDALAAFRDAGCFLLDATETPVNNFSRAARRKKLRDDLPELLKEMEPFEGLPLILLYSSVLEVCGPVLRAAGHRVLNDRFISPSFQWASAAEREIALCWTEHGQR